jgi:O-acetyl-ADP-ribose deacetylase
MSIRNRITAEKTDITRLRVDAIVKNSLRSLAFPAISCGVFGYPIDRATEIAVRETFAGLKANQSLETVCFACFGEEVHSTYASQLAQLE